MKRRVGLLGALVVIGVSSWFLIERLIRHWDSVGPAIRDAPLVPLVAALGTAGAAMIGLGLAWHVILVALGERRGRGEVLSWYFAGEIGKYMPGGVWQLLGRSELATRAGVRRSVAYTSVGLSLLQLVASGAVTVSLIAPWALEEFSPWLRVAGVLVAPLVVGCLHPRVMAVAARLVEKLSRGRVSIPALIWGQAVKVVMAGVPSWALIGVTHLLLSSALGVDASPMRVIGASIIAWVVGIFAVLAPAGLGVREVVFVSVAAMNPGYGAAVSTAARLCFVLVDAVGAALSFAVLARRGRNGATGRSVEMVQEDSRSGAGEP